MDELMEINTKKLENEKRFELDFQSLLAIETEGIHWEKYLNAANKKNCLELVGINYDIFLTTPQLIEKNGYPVEIHKVTTKDGYILTLHRIPHGRKSNVRSSPLTGRPVVFLQQGTFCSSAVWVLRTPEKSLAYRLADQGYDVWLGNSRGTTYSREHVRLSIDSQEYWNFSWHQMGQFDVPANFDYILNLTKQKDLYYIGHSLGTTIFFVAMVLHPEYQSKVKFMSALAPVAFTENVITPAALLAPIVNPLEKVLQYLGVYQIFPHNPLMPILGVTVTHRLSPLQGIVPNIVFLLCGFDEAQLDKDLMTIFLGHVPAGISTKSLLHFGQGVNSGEFRHYDYGVDLNKALYGQSNPPIYDLNEIKVPVAIYYGNNDWLSAKTDVHRLADNLPNLVQKYRVPYDRFNHMDFLFALDVSTLLYEQVERDMEMFGENNQFLPGETNNNSQELSTPTLVWENRQHVN